MIRLRHMYPAIVALVFSFWLTACAEDQEVVDAVAESSGVQDVKSCEDTGETELNSANGEELEVYLCTVKVSAKSVATPLEREAGFAQGSTYTERCFTIGQIDDELHAAITIDLPEECPERY